MYRRGESFYIGLQLLWRLQSFFISCFYKKALLISQEGFQSSARRGSNPRSSPWQGDVVPLYYSRIFNVPTDFHFCEGGCIIQKIISVGVNVIAVLIILSAQNRNRTSDTRIFSPLLYRLSYPSNDNESVYNRYFFDCPA